MILRKSLIFVSLAVLVSLLYCCAQVVPLSGGARDTAPPVLLSVTPAAKSTSVPVKGVKIVFKFNELIAVQQVSQKLIINPQVEEMPEVTAAGKTLTVTFEKDLLPNTTYFLQFGNAVVDIHEGNAYPNLTYLFSTGTAIDSAYITGTATHALTGKPVADLSVMLYKDLRDTAPFLSKPDYFTRSGPDGRYYLSAIKPGRYRLLAAADKNKNLQYDVTEAMGFAEQPFEISSDTVDLKISAPDAPKLFIKKRMQTFWGYNKYVLSDTFPNAYIISEKAIDTDKYQYETRNDTLEVYYRDLYNRSFDFVLKDGKAAFDTVQIRVPQESEVDSSVAKGTRAITVRTGKQVYGSQHEAVVLNFSLPLEDLQADKCVLFRDTVREKPGFTSEKLNEEGNLVTTFLPAYKKRLVNRLSAATSYKLWILPGALQSYWRTTNADTLTVGFSTLAADEISSLQVKLALPPVIKTYVLQLLNSKEQVVSERSGANRDSLVQWFYNLAAGEYALRLIDDANQDAKFSAGSYVNKQQPEAVYFYDKKINVPAGWDVEAEWKLALPMKK